MEDEIIEVSNETETMQCKMVRNGKRCGNRVKVFYSDESPVKYFCGCHKDAARKAMGGATAAVLAQLELKRQQAVFRAARQNQTNLAQQIETTRIGIA